MSYRPFTFNQPTTILFGAGTVLQTGGILKEYGAKKALFLYSGGQASMAHIYGSIRTSARGAGIELVEFGGCRPNPSHTYVDEGAALYRQEGCDFVLCVGGGSVIDASKAIGMLVNNPHPEGIWYYIRDEKLAAEMTNPSAPLGVVLTVAATGAETSMHFVLSNYETQEKLSGTSLSCRPLFAICDPELTMSLGPWLTGSSACDIISHVLEQYIHTGTNTDLSDELSLGVIRTVVKNAPIALRDPGNLDARANLMWASTVALNGILGAGVEENWMAHFFGHTLTAVYGINHGSSLACMTPYYLDYVLEQDVAGKIPKLGKEVFGLSDGPEAGGGAIHALQQFFSELGMPETIAGFEGINASVDDVPALARKTIFNGPIEVGGFASVTLADAESIFRAAFAGTLRH